MVMRTKPFRPNPIHRFYDWLDKLPIPMRLFYPLLLLLSGLLLHLLAWYRGILPSGQFNLTLLFIFIWLVETLALGHYGLRASGPLLDGYRDQLDVADKEFERLRYEFTMIPNTLGNLFLLLGLVLGSFVAISVVPTTPEVIGAFPSFAYFQWVSSIGLGMLFNYFIIRQLRLIPRFFDLTKRIQLSHLEPVYAFSRYTAIIGFGLFMISAVNSFLLVPSNFENAYSSFLIYFFVVFALAIFYLPLRGINQRLIAEKKNLLREVKGRIEKPVMVYFPKFETSILKKEKPGGEVFLGSEEAS